MAQTLKSRSNIRVAIPPSKIPKKQIQAVIESSAGYIFRVKDWNSQGIYIISSCTFSIDLIRLSFLYLIKIITRKIKLVTKINLSLKRFSDDGKNKLSQKRLSDDGKDKIQKSWRKYLNINKVLGYG